MSERLTRTHCKTVATFARAWAKWLKPHARASVATLLAMLLAACSGSLVFAGGGPENVVVVVNADSLSSLTIANHFIHLRKIPANNVVYLSNIKDVEKTDVDQFRRDILRPVLKAIEERGLKKQIDYVIYSSDFPYSINIRGDAGETKLPRVITPSASINGLTFLHEQVLAGDLNYLQLNANRYMRRPVAKHESKPLEAADNAKLVEAVKLLGEKKWDDASEIFVDLVKQHPRNAALQYNLACCLARQEQFDESLAALANAVEAGWSNRRHTVADEDLKTLADREDFKKLLDDMDKQTFDVQPTLGFRSSDRWDQNGERVDEDGQRYLLSTMLAVTSGRGNTVDEAVAALQRSATADGTAPEGTIYFPVNKNVRSTTRDGAYRSAVEALTKLGVRAEILEGTIPRDKNDVQGAMIGAASFDWAASGSTIMPGAICEHLTSFGGVLKSGAGQTPLTEFIRHGAAGASGTVTEPFAIQAKFPFPFMHVHYARGCSLAESFYQSVFGPYQLLIVGDPLCQPWARVPKVSVAGLTDDQELKQAAELTPTLDEDQTDAPIERYELFVDGVRLASCNAGEKLTLEIKSLDEGHHEARVVAIRSGLIATQGRRTIPFVVPRRSPGVSLVTESGVKNVTTDTFTVRAAASGASSIAITHNSRTLATIEGEAGEVELASAQLGNGPVQLQSVATIKHEPVIRVRSAPLKLVIDVKPRAPDEQP